MADTANKTWRRLTAFIGSVGVLMLPWWYLWDYLPVAAHPLAFMMAVAAGPFMGVGLLYYVIRAYQENKLSPRWSIAVAALTLLYFGAVGALMFFAPPLGIIFLGVGAALGTTAGRALISDFHWAGLLNNLGVGCMVASWIFTFVFPPVGVPLFFVGLLLWLGTKNAVAEKSQPLSGSGPTAAVEAKRATNDSTTHESQHHDDIGYAMQAQTGQNKVNSAPSADGGGPKEPTQDSTDSDGAAPK